MIPRRDRRTVRALARQVQRQAELARQLPELYDGASYGLLLHGCGMMELVVEAARWLGACDITISTFGLSLSSIRMMDRAPASSVTWLLDKTTDWRRPKVVEAAQENGTVYMVPAHCKVAVLLTPDRGIVLAGSANATKTRGYEWMDVDVDRDYAESVLALLLGMMEE